MIGRRTHAQAAQPSAPQPVAEDGQLSQAAELTAEPKLSVWLSDEADLGLIFDLLHEVIDPELGVNIVDLGLVYGVRVTDRVVRVRMTLTTPGCPLSGYIDDSIRDTLSGIPGVDSTETDIVWDPPWSPEMMSELAKEQLGWRR